MPIEEPQAHEKEVPIWYNIQQICDLPKEPLPSIIPNLWRQEEVLLIGSHSKSWKSWNLMDVMYTIANGFTWMIWPKAVSGRVLYVDLELSEYDIRYRFESIRTSYGAGNLTNIDILSLRGADFDFSSFTQIKDFIEPDRYIAIAIDPTYKLLAGSQMSESDPSTVIKLMNAAQALGKSSGAGVALLQHFSKGSQTDKRALDAFSGTGVWGRAPDTCVTFRELTTDRAYQVTCDFRAHPSTEPFAVNFVMPRFRYNQNLDPDDLKQPKRGASKKYSSEDVCNAIDDAEYVSYSNLLRRLQWKERTFARYLLEAKKKNWLSQNVTEQTYFLTSQYLKSHRNGAAI